MGNQPEQKSDFARAMQWAFGFMAANAIVVVVVVGLITAVVLFSCCLCCLVPIILDNI